MALVGNERGYLDLDWTVKNGSFVIEAENHDGDTWRTAIPVTDLIIKILKDLNKAERKEIMGNIWDEFDKAFDTEALAKDVEEAAENGGRRDVPHDTYEIAVQKLELTKSKKGDPMVTCWMKIVEGEYKGSLIFMNQVVTQGFQIHIVNEFVRSLISEMADPIDVHFKTYAQYHDMLMDVMEAIDNNFEYSLDYRQNSKGYNEFEIKEVYVLED